MEFDRGLSHSSLNITRSAISLITDLNIADDPGLRRFFKGVSKKRPSKPKYNFTWDPKSVLEYFSNCPANENLSFKDLSHKLVTLLALVTGHRIQTLSLIKIDNVKVLSSKILILIPDRIKNSRQGSNQPLLEIPFYRNNVKICPASTLTHYLDVTKTKRGSIQELFISLNLNKCKAVCKQTLSNWVRETLSAAGIDTSVFKAHNAHHAANSAAKRLGVDMSVILKTAQWSSESTFARFYDRPLINENSNFALSILNQ